jgi:uncharacterized protein with HEPN domain
MPRDARAYLSDIIESCDAIGNAVAGLELETYSSDRLVRSAVEREFITIGEAITSLSRVAPDLFEAISDARMIIGLRNVLTHDYAAVDDETVLGVATSDVDTLRRECEDMLQRMRAAEPADGADTPTRTVD